MRITRVNPRPLVLAMPALLCLLAAEASSSPRGRARADLPIDGRALSPASAWPLDVQLEFRAATFGANVAEAGLEAVDLDGDTDLEIVVAASGGDFWPAQFWYVAERRGAGYRQTWVSPSFPDVLTSLAVGNVDADAAPEVVVAVGTTLHVYDGATREQQWIIDTTALAAIRSLQVADLDADGAVEIAFCDYGGLYVYDAVTGAEEVAGLLNECQAVAVGNVDGDAGLEIVLASGYSPGYVLDAATRVPEWTHPGGFGTKVKLGDVDGDGIAEIVAGENFHNIHVFDAVDQVEQKAIFTGGPIHSLAVADVEGDGALEILYGSNAVFVLDGTGTEKWHTVAADSGFEVRNIVVADTDTDEAREIVWGLDDRLEVTDTATHEIEWQSLAFHGPFYGLAHGDVDADGRPEFLYTSSSSGYLGTGDGLYFIYGAVNKRLRYVSPEPTGGGNHGWRRVQIANVDGDPQLEVLLAASDFYQGVLICYDGLTHAEQWRAAIDDGLSIASLQVADVDADGQLEAVIGTEFETTAAPGTFVYVVDAATGAIEWRSPDTESGSQEMSLLRLAQLDADPALEILVAEYYGRLFVFDGITHAGSVLADDVTALDTFDTNGDGRAEVFAGTASGLLHRVRPGRRWPPRVITRYDQRIDGLAVRDVTGDGVADYTFAVDGRVTVIEGRSRSVWWESPWMGREPGAHDSLLIADIDRDGRLELMVNTDNVGVDIYEVPAAAP